MIKIKNPGEIEKMRKACKLATKLLDHMEPYIKEGTNTLFLNDLAAVFTRVNGAVSAPLNYRGFPKSICTSINNVVCHGIPSTTDVLQNGDIVNIDVTVILDGYHGDTSRTYCIGEVESKVRDFVERTEKAMYLGIDAVKPDTYLFEVGRAIEKYIRQFGYSIVQDYTGHGIGLKFHENPQVFHHYTKANRILLKKGMTFTVEPMINMGRSYKVKTSKSDGWTVTTADGSLSAQFEHTVLVTDEGVEILTKC